MKEPFSNHLAGETSPYLLQHAHNPVDWYPWNETTLLKAKTENKLMIISIGYAACHWCHVMEHESFEDREVAEVMNKDFVSIKVDREERPDVDQVYMHAAYVVTGRGGWPLNVVALPDGRPIYAGTYFPRRNWIHLLNEISSLFRDQPEELNRQAESILRKIRQMDEKPSRKTGFVSDMNIPDRLFNNLLPGLDFENGGTSGEPKFPMPPLLDFLMHYSYISGNVQATSFLELTLDKMASGGIYDHLGGGFFRYSTDDHWHVPHFEKMLYDNAQLLSLYSKAFQRFRKPLYAEVVTLLTGFIERELTSPKGLFYSSIDADSEGKEGAFYVWTREEAEAVLGPDHADFCDFINITREGNWEDGKNVLWNPGGGEISDLQRKAKEILFQARQKRVRPALDNKIITSWNAMMISGYVDAFKASGENMLLTRAKRAAQVYINSLNQNQQLFRLLQVSSIQYPVSSIRKPPAFLDDYAFLIKAFLDLYQSTFDTTWLNHSGKLAEYCFVHFFDEETGLFFYTSDEDPPLLTRSMEISDNVIASSNSVMAGNLLVLGHLLGEGKWTRLQENMLAVILPKIFTNPAFYSQWATVQTRLLVKPYEVSIVGKEWREKLIFMSRGYLPFVIFSGGEDAGSLEILRGKAVEGKTPIYICRDKTCSEPFDNAEKALGYLQKEIEHGIHGK